MAAGAGEKMERHEGGGTVNGADNELCAEKAGI